ncbi:MAG: aminodeoxychorismate/anthranilate synthase component II [Planctomycetaceae bacterium]|nr:aminodeoxychorismate/anthranilate synthase component II [Planctomycetaceae bacterium]
MVNNKDVFMILMIDNYDSFTFNLVQYLRMLGSEVQVFRNDKIDISAINSLSPSGIVISPGPGRPEEAGISLDVIREFSGKIPILGVCLGHQSIVQVCGGNVIRAKKIMHGKTSKIKCDGTGIFQGITGVFEAMRYHSLVAERETLPNDLIITAESEDDNEIMGVRHKSLPLEGIQFHPESIMTIIGKRLLRNFINSLV